MKKIVSLICALALAVTAFAQVQVRGIVTEPSGDPVIGAAVFVEGTSISTVTDGSGRFEISAPRGQKLTVSLLGMKPVVVDVPTDGRVLEIIMSEDTEFLDDVVVVGYGVTKKRDLAGSVSSIKADDVKAGVITSTAQMLRGRAAGVYVRQNSNSPGGGISIRIRGASSISSENEPLYVIDGIIGSADNGLSPEDIESIEILKDAASTAIYGARGANGVVIITTKKGKKDQFSVDYNYNMSAKFLHNPFELMDAQDIMNNAMKNWEENGKSGTPPYTEQQLAYKGPGEDWIKAMSRVGVTQNHTVTMTAGSEVVKAAASIAYLDDVGTILNTGFNRLSSRLNIDFQVAPWLHSGISAYTAKTKRKYLEMETSTSDHNAMYSLFLQSPTKLAGDDGLDIWGERGRRAGAYDSIMNSDNNSIGNNSYVTVYAEAKPYADLTARVQYSYRNSNSKSQQYWNRQTVSGGGENGIASVSKSDSDYHQAEAVLTWNHYFADAHDVKVIAGTSYITNSYESMSMNARNFTTDAFRFYNMGAAGKIDGIGTSRSDKTNLSFFGRVEYVLLDKYILNASFRADGASNFGQNNKWGYFPSVSAAWQVGDEPFMEWAKPALSSLKLRASWGRTGNDGIGNYGSLKTYSTSRTYIGGASYNTTLQPSSAGNIGLKWETTTQTDFGFDAEILDGKVEVVFDWYKKLTTDLLNPIIISNATLGLNSTTGNNGSISNVGEELFIKWHIVENRNFSWNTALSASHNRSKIESINQVQYVAYSPQGWYNDEPYVILDNGLALSSIYGYNQIGIIEDEDHIPSTMPAAQPGDPIFEDHDGDGTVTEKDRYVLGIGTPPVQIGWANNFRWGNFDFSFFFDGSFGSKILNYSRLILEDNNRLKYCTDRWTNKNHNAKLIRGNYQKNGGLQYGTFVNSHFIEDGSFLRLSNIELGYNIPTAALGINNVIKACRIFVGGQKLFTISKYTGFDPEVSSNGSNDTIQGLDYASYPSYRTFNCGVRVSF